MKIYQYHPISFIRLQVTQQKQETEYLTLCECTLEEAEKWLTELISKQNISAFEKVKTSINIREALGGKNGKSKAISFRGLNPIKVIELIKANLS